MNTPLEKRLQLRFVFDEHVNAQAMEQLQLRGIEVVSVSVMDVGLDNPPDPDIFGWARNQGRFIVIRNYHDLAPLVAEASRQGIAFPGVLFCATSLRQADVGGHVKALEYWTSCGGSRHQPCQEHLWLATLTTCSCNHPDEPCPLADAEAAR